MKTGNATSGSISIVDGADGNISILPNGTGQVILDNLTFPANDGSANQVLKTDGNGTLSWTANGGSGSGASEINDLTDALVEDNSVYIGNDPSSTTNAAGYNVAVGTTALDAITTADYNTALGHDALSSNTTGS